MIQDPQNHLEPPLFQAPVHQNCSMLFRNFGHNQTRIIEGSTVSYQNSTLFFPQNSYSHSRLSIFSPELSFSFWTLKNLLERSHSRSRISVNVLSQKYEMLYYLLMSACLYNLGFIWYPSFPVKLSTNKALLDDKSTSFK